MDIKEVRVKEKMSPQGSWVGWVSIEKILILPKSVSKFTKFQSEYQL